MKNRIWVSLLASAFVAAGCASSPSAPAVDPARMTETEVAIRSAENAGAAQGAPEFFDRAQKALVSARQAATRGDNVAARAHLDEANAFAAAAQARARAEKSRTEAARAKQQADELDARVRELQQEARSQGRER